MVATDETVKTIHKTNPDTVIIVGGAPVTEAFAQEIGASGYAPNAPTAIDVLDRLQSAV